MTTWGNSRTAFCCAVYPQVFEVSGEAAGQDSMKINHTITLSLHFTEPRTGELIEIVVPWGEKETDFTGKEWGRAIIGSVTSGSLINEAENADWGKYWVVKLADQQKLIEVAFENVNFLTEGITCIMLNYHKQADAGQNECLGYRLPVLKTAQDLKIVQFEAQKRTVMTGQSVKLSWKVSGADSVYLNPGNIPLSLAGTRQVCVNRSVTFTLCARKGGQTKEKELAVYTGGDAVALEKQ